MPLPDLLAGRWADVSLSQPEFATLLAARHHAGGRPPTGSAAQGRAACS